MKVCKRTSSTNIYHRAAAPHWLHCHEEVLVLETKIPADYVDSTHLGKMYVKICVKYKLLEVIITKVSMSGIA